MHPSGQTLEAQVAFLGFHLRRFSLSPIPDPSAPALARDPFHEGKGGRHCTLQKEQLTSWGPLGRPAQIQRSQSDSVGGQSFQKGLSSRPHNRAGLEFPAGPNVPDIDKPCVPVCLWKVLGGGLPVIAPQNPSSPDSAVRQLRATFCQEVTPKAVGSAAELLLHSCSGPPVSGGTDRTAGGAVVGFWVSPTPWQS